jgi:steroid delta-isomerase-like uncharacterized protein
MSEEDNKTIVRLQHEEVWNKGNLSLIEEIYTPDFVCHFIVGPEWHGREGVRRAITRHRTSFPDWEEHIEDIIADGDKVVTRWTATGTHEGEFEGIPPTGNQVTIAEVAIYRIADGKIAEQWGFPNIMGLLRQIGADP